MGVTGLWTVVQPCARPIKIETLNKKRLAVDASIWIYQFLKAVRDKEGNALRNSHVVGFFRRICKLLFIGIKPVFVFDGGAPVLKRQTIQGRKQRREGRREDATRTAGKLLALQMQRLAGEDDAKRKRAAQRGPERDYEEEEVPEDNMVYVDELQMTQKERQQNRKFKKKDQYHLPDLDMSLAEMAPNDPRIMSLEELEAYARQFDTGEDINVYDFSKIDFDSPFFVSLPASDRYNILNAARLRSRLRMGYSKEQLDTMFPDRMAFSKFQIERVTERNDLTQRLMNINGMNDDGMYNGSGSGRIAGEKGREYVLVRNEGVEGGWALGVVGGNEEGRNEDKPIDVDELDKEEVEEDEWEEDDGFEDVPIEGLNRLPKTQPTSQPQAGNGVIAARRAAYKSRRQGAPRRRAPPTKPIDEDPDSLFVADENEGEVEATADVAMTSDDEDLQRAIALSMEQDDQADEQEGKEDWIDVFEQKRAEEARPLPRGRGQAIAHIVNSRAGKVVPAARSVSPGALGNIENLGVQVARPRPTSPMKGHPQSIEKRNLSDSDNDSDDMDFQAALAESRQTKYQSKSKAARTQPKTPTVQSQPAIAPKKSGFSGPLPFEKLDLGSSLLGKKKMEKIQQDNAGGFERADAGPGKNKQTEPLPPWFSGNLDDDMAAQRRIEQEDREKAKSYKDNFHFQELPTLQRQSSQDVIDLDDDMQDTHKGKDIIQLESSDEEDQVFPIGRKEVVTRESLKLGDMADAIRSDPAIANQDRQQTVAASAKPQILRSAADPTVPSTQVKQMDDKVAVETKQTPPEAEDKDGQYEWEESDKEEMVAQVAGAEPAQPRSRTMTDRQPSKSPSPEFEDVVIPDQSVAPEDAFQPDGQEKAREEGLNVAEEDQGIQHVPEIPSAPTTGIADQNMPAEAGEDNFGYYSDSEDDELMRQFAVEAEEHARFASELNHKPQQQNIEDYERELKQLRSQQKKDRRDADEVTQVMIQECQQLLKLFGLPYVTAPMEAEAQCAELVSLGLVDGIVTDDSDCFLFGGTRIYKNMFNQAKYVECYLTSDFEKEFDLTRQKLIGIAQLLGSDYTEGLPGVGPVTALEILSEFASLQDFKKWFEGVQMNTIPKCDDAGNPFRRKFRRQATKLLLPPAFPDPRVELAYLQPEVDSDPSQFQWGVPDLVALRNFLMATIGWSQERTDEVLVPVIKDMNRRMDEGTQSNITAFFEGGAGAGAGAYAPRQRVEQGSKRMGSALERLAQKAKRKRRGEVIPDVEAEEASRDAEPTPEQELEHPARKKRATRAKRGGKKAAAATTSTEEV
ncbi:hypothetical protein BDV97DRAFT_352463 [Delphinella strobiligena]|nr:hypothetical protein BDV97DRAFT_352463 [Delphinella strobiligena]